MPRYRVDFKYSYISLDASEKERAWKLYEEQDGIRIRYCTNIHDKGYVVEGEPIYEDHTLPQSWEVN